MRRGWFVLSVAFAGALASQSWCATDAECNRMLEQALADKNPDTRMQAVVALSLAATRDPVFSRLEGMLKDSDVLVRVAAVNGLAELKTEDAKVALRKALEDPVPEVSFAAAKALYGL